MKLNMDNINKKQAQDELDNLLREQQASGDKISDAQRTIEEAMTALAAFGEPVDRLEKAEDMEKAPEVKTFTINEIKAQVSEILGKIGAVKKINELNISPAGDKLILSANITAKKVITTEITLSNANLVNRGNSIALEDGYTLSATKAEDMVKGMFNDKVGSIGKEIKKYIEQQEGKEVEKIEIENGELKVTFALPVVVEDKPEPEKKGWFRRKDKKLKKETEEVAIPPRELTPEEARLEELLGEARLKYAQAYKGFMAERRKGLGYFTRAKEGVLGVNLGDTKKEKKRKKASKKGDLGMELDLNIDDKEKALEIPPELKALEKEYEKVARELAEEMYAVKQAELENSPLSLEEREAELKRYKQYDIRTRVILTEESIFSSELKVENLPPKEKGIVRKGFAWYFRQKKPIKVAIATLITTSAIAGISYSTGIDMGGLAESGLAAFAAGRAGRAIIGATVGSVVGQNIAKYGEKIYDWGFKRNPEEIKRLQEAELSKAFAEESFDTGIAKNRKEYARILEREKKAKISRAITKGIITILAGVGVSIEAGRLGGEVSNILHGDTGQTVDNIPATPKPVEPLGEVDKSIERSMRQGGLTPPPETPGSTSSPTPSPSPTPTEIPEDFDPFKKPNLEGTETPTATPTPSLSPTPGATPPSGAKIAPDTGTGGKPKLDITGKKIEKGVGASKATPEGPKTPQTPVAPAGSPDAALQNMTVHKGQGIEHAFTKQIENNTDFAKRLGYTGKIDDAKALHTFAQNEAHKIALENNKANLGISEADKASYKITDVDDKGKAIIEEGADNKKYEYEYKKGKTIIEDKAAKTVDEPRAPKKVIHHNKIKIESKTPDAIPPKAPLSPEVPVEKPIANTGGIKTGQPMTTGGKMMTTGGETFETGKTTLATGGETFQTGNKMIVTGQPMRTGGVLNHVVDATNRPRIVTGPKPIDIPKTNAQPAAPTSAPKLTATPGSSANASPTPDEIKANIETQMDAKQILDKNPEFAKNILELPRPKLLEAATVYQKNIDWISKDPANESGWLLVKDAPVKNFISVEVEEDDIIVSYLNKLKEITKLEPGVGLLKKSITVNDYIQLAVQKATELEKLDKVKLF